MSNKEELPDSPPEFECSITAARMEDPVIAADGFSYERVAIEKWFSNHTTSPKTGEQLSSTDVLPNLTLLTLIKEWVDDLQNLKLQTFMLEHRVSWYLNHPYLAWVVAWVVY